MAAINVLLHRLKANSEEYLYFSLLAVRQVKSFKEGTTLGGFSESIFLLNRSLA